MLANFSNMVDVSKAEAAVNEDKLRELATIGPANIPHLNKAVATALTAGAQAADESVVEVGAQPRTSRSALCAPFNYLLMFRLTPLRAASQRHCVDCQGGESTLLSDRQRVRGR